MLPVSVCSFNSTSAVFFSYFSFRFSYVYNRSVLFSVYPSRLDVINKIH